MLTETDGPFTRTGDRPSQPTDVASVVEALGHLHHSPAADNNLRRLGARRGQARDEARRIEAGLARLLEKRGFRTLLDWVPPRGPDDAGEVDLIAVLDGRCSSSR